MPAHDSLSLEAMSARAGSLTQYAQRQARQAAASSGMHDGAHGADSWQQQGRHMDTSETSSGSRLSSGGMNGVELTTRAAYSAPQFTYAQEAAHQAQVLHHQQLEHERLRQRERMVREREREREEQLIRSHSRHQQQHQSSQRPSGEQQHRVYLLNCKHCGNFLSDRGMKAVLLLKPNITLYSTDAMPSNCGPLYPSRVAGSSEPPVERTCECLTQSLGCYGCGAQVGYNIVSPCARCTSSVVKHQRSSNGHRTVLHCSEISVRERRYVPGEPGILASPPPLPPSYLSLGALGVRTHSDDALASYSSSRDGSSTSLNSLHYNGLDDPLDAEKAEAAALAAAQAAEAAAVAVAAAHAQAQHAQSRSSSGWKKTPRVLRRGDSVYWSDLVPGGERAEPFDPDLILSMPIAGR